MGEGKTEAPDRCEQLSAKTQASGMFFGLPNGRRQMESLSESKSGAPDDERKSLQLVHGKAVLNETYTPYLVPML